MKQHCQDDHKNYTSNLKIKNTGEPTLFWNQNLMLTRFTSFIVNCPLLTGYLPGNLVGQHQNIFQDSIVTMRHLWLFKAVRCLFKLGDEEDVTYRYSFISSSESFLMMELGNIFSTKMFCFKTISSPAGDRNACNYNTLRKKYFQAPFWCFNLS